MLSRFLILPGLMKPDGKMQVVRSRSQAAAFVSGHWVLMRLWQAIFDTVTGKFGIGTLADSGNHQTASGKWFFVSGHRAL